MYGFTFEIGDVVRTKDPHYTCRGVHVGSKAGSKITMRVLSESANGTERTYCVHAVSNYGDVMNLFISEDEIELAESDA